MSEGSEQDAQGEQTQGSPFGTLGMFGLPQGMSMGLPQLGQSPLATPMQFPWQGPMGPMGIEGSQSLFGHFANTPLGPWPGSGAEEKKKPTLEDYRGTMDKTLDGKITANRKTRTDLDKARADKAPTVGDTEKQLGGDRKALLESLKERSGVYNQNIDELGKQLPAKMPKNLKDLTPEQKKALEAKQGLEKERDKYKDQQTALQRWSDRQEINGINEKLKDPALDEKAKKELLAKKKGLAQGLLSTTKGYQQFDERWGDSVYGKDKSYTSMTEAGCGPTALAIMADFADQEDPEGKRSQGIQDHYNPRRMADYATNHGRVKGSGTDGNRMMGDLSGSFPGFEGHALNTRANATESLENGVPVMVLGHDIHGTRADGEDTKYGGHFMVLNGVSDDRKNYSVLDGGRNSNRNIRSMTDKQLGAGAAGYWNTSHKP